MLTTPELPGISQSPRRRTFDPKARLADLVAVLRGRGWIGAKDLQRLGFSERRLRLIVEHDTDGQVLAYPGSRGYRLFDEATLAEIEMADSLRSQARAMLRRWMVYQRRRHRHGVSRQQEVA